MMAFCGAKRVIAERSATYTKSKSPYKVISMKKFNAMFRFVFFASMLFPLTYQTGSADDWPRWMGAEMDGVWRETGIIDRFTDGKADIAWRTEIGAGYSGPSVVGNRLYVMDRIEDKGKGIEVENAIRKAGQVPGIERVLCLDTESGDTLWSHQYDCPYKIAYPTGPRCTPAVDGEHVYTLGAMGHLICLNSKFGDVVWEKDLSKEYETKPPVWGFASHPLVDGDKLLVPVGGEGTGVVAFDKLTGKELWRAVTTMDVAYAPLVIYEKEMDERQLIYWHADGVTSLNPETGAEYWTVKFPEKRNMSQTSIATPRIVGDKLFISEFYKGSLLLQVGSHPPSVKELWRSFKTDPRHKTGLNSMMTTPVVKDGHAYGIAYAGRGEGVFRCIELETGDLKWTNENWMGDEPIVFATAFIVENNGRYFMMSDAGELIIAKLTPEQFEEIDRAKILEPTGVARGRKVVWAHPAFSGGKMFMRNDKEMVCVDLRQE